MIFLPPQTQAEINQGYLALCQLIMVVGSARDPYEVTPGRAQPGKTALCMLPSRLSPKPKKKLLRWVQLLCTITELVQEGIPHSFEAL